MLKRGIQGEKFFGQILGCKKAKLIFVLDDLLKERLFFWITNMVKKNNGKILKGKLNIMSTLTFGSRIMLCKLKILFFLLSCLSFFLNGATVLFLIFQQQKP